MLFAVKPTKPRVDQSHPCETQPCSNVVPYDDEPDCFDHSPDSGSYVIGYSYKAKHSKK